MTTQAEKDAILDDLAAATAAVESARARTAALAVDGAPPPPEPPPPSGLDAGRFTSFYEGGNGANPVVLSPSEGQVDAEPDLTRTWTTPFDFEWAGVAGLAPTFRVRLKWGLNAVFGSPSDYASTSFLAWYTQDGGTTWQRCASVSYDPTAQIISITPSATPLSLDTIRVAEAVPYTDAQYSADRASWVAGGFCTETVIGTSVQGRPIYRLSATDPGTPASGKKAVYLAFSGHEQERHAAWRLKGLLDWLTGPSPEAAVARGRLVVHVVLRSNPDAYVNGWMRVNADGIQTNRWNVGPPSLSVEGPEQYAVHADVEARALDASLLKVFVDFHTSQAPGEKPTPDPNSAALTALPTSFFAAGRIGIPITTETWAGTNWSHRVVKTRLPSVACAVLDTSGTRYISGELVSPTTAQEVGVSIIRSLDTWLLTH